MIINVINQLNKKTDVLEISSNTFFKYAGDAIFMIAPSFQITEVNDRACILLNYSSKELKEKKIFELFPDDEQKAFLAKVKIIDKVGSSIHERRLKRKDGSIVYAEVNVHLIEGGGYISIFRDITERKKAEIAVKEHVETFTAIIENANESIWLISLDLKVLQFNKTAQERLYLHRGKEIYIGADFREYLFDGTEDFFMKMFNDAVSGKYPEVESKQLNIHGNLFWMRTRMYPVYNTDKKLIGVTVLTENITERKKVEEALTRNNAELQKTNTELDRFVYSTSHDLRAPLKSMLGLINIIKGKIDDSNELQQECISMLNKSVVKLDNFIEDILDYSRNSRLEVSKDAINFKELIHEITANHKFIEETKRSLLQVEIQQDGTFISDKRRIAVILNNLISNAIKYSKPSIENSFIKIIVTCTDEKALITVADNGIGIAESEKDKIFEMFYRATISSTGSGLGLYILKESLEKLGGKINLESQLNIGTTFHIEIPNLQNAIN